MRNPSVLAFVTVLALAAPAHAQQNPDQIDRGGPITILKNMTAEADGIIVRIDGREIDRLREVTYDDITTVVKTGANTLTVSWSHPIQRLRFKVAFAATRNDFKNVLVVDVDSNTDGSLNQPGAKTWAFTIPPGTKSSKF
jgi:hypothetical protein